MQTNIGAIEILIAEDSPTQAEKLVYLLEGKGYRVNAAVNGREALAAARRHKPTLVISDVLMPEMNGFELCRGIKADPGLREVPVILVTTLADPHDVILGLESGADLFVRKPYEDRYLLSRIDYVLMNLELRKHRNVQIGMEITLGGERHFITAERQQILDLLISTYEQAIEINNELKQRERALQEEKDKADAANQAKSKFLAFMSHEIRTPMNGMLGMIELLAMTQLDAQQKEALQIVLESGKSLQAIIDEVLDLAKIESGKMELRPRPASLADVVDATRNLFSGAASARGVAMRSAVDPQLAPAHRVDPLRLRQVLNNLVSNALKFTALGHVEVRAERVERSGNRERVRFAVEDTGSGIAPEHQRRLFQAFTQTDDNAARAASGTGLGLMISKHLVELMGGSLELRSEPGKGTVFSFTVPLDVTEPPTPASAPQLASADARRPPLAAGSAMRVLVVDDHPINRMVLEKQVQLLGYQVECAELAAEAIGKWESGDFHVVITDCHMPEMDGYELTRRIRERESAQGRPRTPIIAYTANAMADEAEKCRSAGMDDYLAKPVALAQLREKLERWLPK